MYTSKEIEIFDLILELVASGSRSKGNIINILTKDLDRSAKNYLDRSNEIKNALEILFELNFISSPEPPKIIRLQNKGILTKNEGGFGSMLIKQEGQQNKNTDLMGKMDKTNSNDQSSIPTLIPEHSKFKKILEDRIRIGKKFIGQAITTKSEAEVLQDDLWKWHEYNVELIHRSFIPSENEYYSSLKSPTPSPETWKHAFKSSHGLQDKVTGNKNAIMDRVKILERLLNKIDLIPQAESVINVESKSSGQPKKELHLMDIFISHSNQDMDIAESIINLIRKAYNLSANRIRCTSVEGYKLPIGVSTDEQLKKEIFSSKVFIGVITSHSITSTYVLFELGARWGTTYPLLPLICDPIGSSLLEGPLRNINALKTTDPSDILQFIYDLGTHLDSKPENTNSYLKEIQHLKEISSRRDKTEVPEVIKHKSLKTETEDYESVIKAQSLIEWPDNYEMQFDHIKRQRNAVQELKKEKPQDLTEEEFERIRMRAKNEWPFNYEMRVYEEIKQIESLRKLKTL